MEPPTLNSDILLEEKKESSKQRVRLPEPRAINEDRPEIPSLGYVRRI